LLYAMLRCGEEAQQSVVQGHEQTICDGRSYVGFFRKRPLAAAGTAPLRANCRHRWRHDQNGSKPSLRMTDNVSGDVISLTNALPAAWSLPEAISPIANWV